MNAGRLGAGLAVAAALFSVSVGGAGATTPPDGFSQAPQDGCQRNALGLLTWTSPEWVYVYRDVSTHYFEGTVLSDESHPGPGGGDLPEGHEWYDFNADVQPPPGSPYAYETGIDHSTGQPYGYLHMERESGQMPMAAWMTAGDHLAVWGSWIWDCGHWGPGLDFTNPADEADRDYVIPGSGQVPGDNGTDVGNGESPEFHPMKALAVTRANPYYPNVEETETDFYISNYGTIAHAESYCAATSTSAGPTMGPDYSACLQNSLNRYWNVNDRDYSFFVPAPPKPSPDATLRVAVRDNPGNVGNLPPPVLDVRSDGVEVTFPFKSSGQVPDAQGSPQCDQPNPRDVIPPFDCPTQAASKAVFVGWDGSTQRVPAEIELKLKTLKVFHSLDMPGFDTALQEPPGEYGINMDANGLWAYLNDYSGSPTGKSLDRVMDGDSFDLQTATSTPATFRLRVPDGGRVRLAFTTRECDLPRMNPCAATNEVAEDNDNPGDATVVYDSASQAVGDHVVSGGPASDPNWSLTYSIAEVRPAAVESSAAAGPPGGPVAGSPAGTYPNSGGPGSGSNAVGQPPQLVAGARSACVDTSTPRSRFRGRVTRRGLRLRGVARDRDCRGRSARVARVQVALARRAGARCRWLVGGRFGAPVSCSAARGFMRTRGTSRWHFARTLSLARGRYLVVSRAIDRAGNVEYRRTRGNHLSVRLR